MPADRDSALDQLEQRALDAWTTDEPPSDFASRVLEAERAQPATEGHSPSVWRQVVLRAGVMAAALAGAFIGFQQMFADPPSPRPDAAGVRVSPEDHAEPIVPRASLDTGGAARPLPDDFAAKLGSYVDSYGAKYGPAFRFHGAILVARDGEVVFNRGFGMADLSAGIENSAQTRFRIGSLTEQFTAAAILLLQERGLLDIDEPVTAYIPDYPSDTGNKITLRHLLSHESGIPNFTDDFYISSYESQPHTTEQMLARFMFRDLEFEPGTDFDPSNSGYVLLGAVIERVSGMSYGDFVAQNIFTRAGMEHATYGDAFETGEQARGYVFNEDEFLQPAAKVDLSVYGATGALVMSPTDILAWDQALYDERLLQRASIDEMFGANSETAYALGWVVDWAYGQSVVGHPGGINGYNAHIMRFLGDRTLVFAVANTEAVDCRRIADAVAALVYDREPAPHREYDEVEVEPVEFPKMLGTYLLSDTTRNKLGALVDPDQLEMMAEVHVLQDRDHLALEIPGHGMKWMHFKSDNEVFFKDPIGTTGEFAGEKAGRAEFLYLRLDDVEFLLRREEHRPSPPRRP